MGAPEEDPELAGAETEQDVTKADRTRKRTPPKPIDEIGAIVANRYKVEKVLGKGGMGTVYVVEHQQIHKRFAMKVLPRDDCDGTRAARFEREAKATSKIGHENIVNVTDFGRTPSGDFFLVMELLEGRDLAHELHEVGKLSVRRSLAIAKQLCRALGAAHDKGIIHRDLKPANLFLVAPKRDFIKILDFGLAQVEERVEGRITRQGTVMGTAQYMAPEQARGEPTDGRSDIYALGCVLYEMLTGIAPFKAKSYNDALELQLTLMPKRPSDVCEPGHIPDALDSVVMRMLAKRPDNRYATMRDVELALRLAAESKPSAKVPAPVEPARRTVRNIGLALGALLIAGATALAVNIHRHVPKSPDGSASGAVNARPPVTTPAPAPLPLRAAPPAPASDAPVLHLRSIPSDALVMIDGAAAGTTPVDIPLPADRALHLELDRDGYRRATLTVSGSSELDREVTLVPLPKRKRGAALQDLKVDPNALETPPDSPPPPRPTAPPTPTTNSHRELKDVLIE